LRAGGDADPAAGDRALMLAPSRLERSTAPMSSDMGAVSS
jgi:hypothetical protein